VVALACAMRTPVDSQSEIKGMIFGIEGIAPGSYETGGHGWTSVPLGRTRLGRRAVVIPAVE